MEQSSRDPGALLGQEPFSSLLAPLTWVLDAEHLRALALRFSTTYRHLAKSSTEHFLPTPVTRLPTGSEKGQFLAIDVGGTNLRVGVIELLGSHPRASASEPYGQNEDAKIARFHEKLWPIEEHLKMDKAEDLFEWIGDCIAEVIGMARGGAYPSDTESLLQDEQVHLGITFSFPMTQTSMSEATLMPMGKGFAITSNLNLGQNLLSGYSRHCAGANAERLLANQDVRAETGIGSPNLPPIKIAAITNDTVATFASLAYATKTSQNSKMAMGLIVGTGCNATVPMKSRDLHPSKRESVKLAPSAEEDEAEIVINTEWTIRGTDLPMRELNIPTKWDAQLDRQSDAPGFQPFEYMTAGRYLGELVRLTFVDLVESEFPSQELPSALRQKNSLTTTFMAVVILRETDTALSSTLLEKFPPPSNSPFVWSPNRCQLLRAIANAVQLRSSALIAAATVGLLACVNAIDLDADEAHRSSFGSGPANSLEQEELVVGYTGSTISGFPGFRDNCQMWIDKLVHYNPSLNKNKQVVLRPALDGGIIGAAVLAGMMT